MDKQLSYNQLFFFLIKILAKFQQNLAKLIEFSLEKENFPIFSQFLCQKIVKFQQKKKRYL
jgi:hypothetical protein